MADITIYEGDTLETDYRIDNEGGETGDQNVALLVNSTQEDADTGVVIQPGGIASGTLTWVTKPGDAGTYDIVVESNDDSKTREVLVEVPVVDVSTVGVSNVEDDQAQLEGELLEATGVSAVDLFFEYRETSASSFTATTPVEVVSPQTYADTITGLSAETEYEMRAAVEAVSKPVSDTGSTTTWTTPSAIPDSVVSRDPDDSSFSGGTAKKGLRIKPTEEWPDIGAELSGFYDGGTTAYVHRVSDGTLKGSTDISGLSAGDTFAVTGVNLQPDTEYNFVVDAGGSEYTFGFDEDPNFPYTSPDGQLEITGGGENESSTESNALNLLQVGNVGLS